MIIIILYHEYTYFCIFAGYSYKLWSLFQELYEAFIEDARRRNNVRLMLTIAVGAGKQVIDSAYDVPEISRSNFFLFY